MTSKVINGVGQVTGTDACDIINYAFKVPARVNGRTDISGKLGELRIPDVESVLTEEQRVSPLGLVSRSGCPQGT